MTSEERRQWIMLVVTIAAYATYLALVLSSASDNLVDTPYAPTMLITIGGAIVAAIVLNILSGIIAGDGGKKDQRDREIGRMGEYTGQAFVIAGAVAALLLAMIEAPWFWIANVIYLAFVLSSILGSIAKVVAYRKGL